MEKRELIRKVKEMTDLTPKEKSYLIELINNKKKYGLVWENKPEDVEEQLRSMLPVLKEDKKKAILSEEKEAPNHILIEGDNLHALTALSFTHKGKIDVIYIDPPYNTENKDFIYNDNYVDKEDSFRHSKWLSFINKRLKLAKILLKKNGIIFISIDNNELAQLKLLCDEVFGSNNCENLFTIKVRHENRILRADIRYHQTTEYLLCYRVSDKFVPPRRENKKNKNKDYVFDIEITNKPTKIENIEGYVVEIYNKDSYKIKECATGKGLFKNYSIRGSLITQKGSASEFYEKNLRKRKTKDGFSTLYKVLGMGKRGDGLGYRYIMQPQNSKIKNGNYFQGRPLNSKNDIGLPYPNFFDFVNEFNVAGYEGGVEFKNGKKPIPFLKKVFELANISDNNIILDFFAGSGSTFETIASLNEEYKYMNKCILVTNNENNICEDITYKRCLNVIKGYENGKGAQIKGLSKNNLRYYKADFVPSEQTEQNRRRLTKYSTELICIKEDCYIEITDLYQSEFIQAPLVRIFTNNLGKHFILIYHSHFQHEVIQELIELIPKLKSKEKVKIYSFSPEKETIEEEFSTIRDKIDAIPLPDSIYNAYKQCFRTIQLNKNHTIVSPQSTEN